MTSGRKADAISRVRLWLSRRHVAGRCRSRTSPSEQNGTRLLCPGRARTSHCQLQSTWICGVAARMNAELASIITSVLKQAPEWIRTDMASKDRSLRERAEEALAAMIAAA